MKCSFFLIVLISIALCSCSRTSYSILPYYGYDLQDSTRLIIAKFQNAPDDLQSEEATQQLRNLYQACASVEVVPYDTVQDLFYRNVSYINPIWDINSDFLFDLYRTTTARYLLVGKVLERASDRPPVSIASSYNTGQVEDIHENFIVLQFTLFDLANGKTVLELHTRTKASQVNYPSGDGDVTSFHAPVRLLNKALEKSIDKLDEICQCRI